MNIQLDLVIKRPVAEVFEYIATPSNESQWQTGLYESKLTSDPPIRAGSTGQDTRKFMGRDMITTWEVTAFEPDSSFDFRVIKGPMPFVGTYTFEAVPEGTRLSVAFKADLKGVSKLFGPIVGAMGSRQYRRDLAKLRSILESRAAEQLNSVLDDNRR